MIIKLAAQIIFYGLAAILAAYSVVMVYVLLRFGQSKILGLVLSGFYIMVIITLYAAAVGNFARLSFPEFEL